MAAVVDPFRTPTSVIRVGLGAEDAGGVTLTAPTTPAAVINRPIVWANIDCVVVIIRTDIGGDQLLIQSRVSTDVTGVVPIPTIFSPLTIDIDGTLGAVTNQDTFLLHVRQQVRLLTGLLIDFEEGSDNRMAVCLMDDYLNSNPVYGWTNTVVVRVDRIEGSLSDLRNPSPADRLFLNWVKLTDLANVAQYPMDAYTSQLDIDLIYDRATTRNYPACVFTQSDAIGRPVGAPGGVSIKHPRIKLPEPFHGFNDSKNPNGKSFRFEEWTEQVVNALTTYPDPSDRYNAYKSLFVGDAYTYIKEFEKANALPNTRTIPNLAAYMQGLSPRAITRDEAKSEFEALKMKQPNESAYLIFIREFTRLTNELGNNNDASLRRSFYEKLHPTTAAALVQDNRCPIDPTEVTVNTPNTVPAVPFLFADMQGLVVELLQRTQVAKSVKPAAKRQSEDDKPMSRGERKRQKKLAKQGKTLQSATATTPTANSSFPKDQRIKACANTKKYPDGHGKNGSFADGTPRTCNNCNDPDHLSHDCPKAAKKASAASANTVTKLSESNLSKKAKKDLRALLQSHASNSPGTTVASADAGAAQPTRVTVAEPLNEQAGSRGGMTRRLEELLG